MKKTLLTGGLILAGISLFAQTQHLSPFKKDTPTKYQLLVQSLLNKQTTSHGTAKKPTGIQQRVIGQTFREDDMTVADSTAYKYSGAKGSKFDHNYETFTYSTYFANDYLPVDNLIDGSVMDLLADSIISYENTIWKGVLRAYYRTDNKIDSTFRISSYTDMGGVTQYSFGKIYNQFNNQGYLNQVTFADSADSSPSFETNNINKYFYDPAQTKLLSDTTYFDNIGVLQPFEAKKYHYNTLNQLDSISIYFNDGSTFHHYGQTYVVYNTAGLIQKTGMLDYDDNGAVSHSAIDSFGYTGNLPFYTYHQFYFVDYTSLEEEGSRVIKYIGAGNLPDSTDMLYNQGAGWLPQVTLKYQYNNYNNPTSIMGTYPDGSFAGGYNFYYETYDDGNSIGIKDPKANKSFNIYPNPFDNKINIDWKNAATQTKVSLINMMGQTIYTLNKSLSTGNNTIDVPVTASGTYILMIQDEKGNTYNQKLTKR